MTVRLRIQEDACRVDAGRRDDHDARANRTLLFGVAVEVLDTISASVVAGEQARDHGIIDDAQPARTERRLDQVVRRVEERSHVAALAARAAVVAGGMAVVPPREHGAPSGHDADSNVARGALEQPFAAAGSG